MTTTTWTHLGALPLPTLISARIELHWAAQIVAALADAALTHAADDSHTNLRWSREHGALLGNPLADARRLGLRFADLTLIVLVDEAVTAARPLAGATLAQGLAWAQQTLRIDEVLTTRDYAMPAHPVGDGGVFSAPDARLAELGRYFESATVLLKEVANAEEGATSIAVWPHHFDLGGIIFLEAGADPERAPQIGVGLSPGDGSIPEPYVYCTPWPIAKAPTFPALEGGGRWHTEGFTGALLLASELLGRDADEQHAMARRFVESALAGGRRLISSAG